ncbi:SNF2 family N-terminal domain-containing protein [Endogone sp. FLAS-F59071]|nr:SNF2 family N-terminal domain-containing protein [Endogone sp. FLAS-F59071]|eukprot:RUS21339.1 SNF2 family N-terminal domain-containing protein [Endogone sp. FLAS-F59071]
MADILESVLGNLDNLLPVGSVDLRTRAGLIPSPITPPPSPTTSSHFAWTPFTADCIPHNPADPSTSTTSDFLSTLTQLIKTNHVRATYLLTPHGPSAYVWYRVRVYLVPEDIPGKRFLPHRNSATAQKATKLLAAMYERHLDTQKSVFDGDDLTPVEKPCVLFPSEPSSSTNQEPTRLGDIYLGMPSPAPDPELIRNTQASPDTLRLLDECFSRPAPRGMITPLYKYQKNTLWKLLQRELLPVRIVDPSLVPLRTVHGRLFYMNPATYAAYLEPVYYDDSTGGIICEDMGTGKTCICLALILATKYQVALPPQQPDLVITSDLDPGFSVHVELPEVPSLRRLAAFTVLQNAIPYTPYRKLIPAEITKYLDANRAYYFVYPQKKKGSRVQDVRKPMKVYLSSATLVVVPDSLVDQWMAEVYKHTKDLALKLLVVSKRDQAIPSFPELLEYDMVLISHGRFGVENEKGGFDFEGIPRKCQCLYIGASRNRDCHCDDDSRYISPLLCVHWKRLIVDEGHTMSSEKTRQVLLSSRLHVSRRWACTGTPTSNLTDTARARALQDEEARSDLDNIGKILRTFLQLKPFSGSKDTWSRLVLRPYFDRRHGSATRLRSIMQRVMVRNRRADIERDVVLPPLYERVVALELTRWQYLTHNCIIAFVALNAVLSERTDVDYFFHRSNTRELRHVVANLWQSLFWYTDQDNMIESVKFALNSATEGLGYQEEGIRQYPATDVELLNKSKQILETALKNPIWNALMRSRQIGYFIQGFPVELQARWALVEGKTVEGRVDEVDVEDGDGKEEGREPPVCVMSLRDVERVMEMVDEVEGEEVMVGVVRERCRPREAAAGSKKRKMAREKSGNTKKTRVNGVETASHEKNGGGRKEKNKGKEKAKVDFVSQVRTSTNTSSSSTMVDLVDLTTNPTTNPITQPAPSLGSSSVYPIVLEENEAFSSLPHITPAPSRPVLDVLEPESVYTRRAFERTALLATTSSKLDYLINEVRKHTVTGEKCVIFSQWWNEMQAIVETLQLAKVRCLLYSTKMCICTLAPARSLTQHNYIQYIGGLFRHSYGHQTCCHRCHSRDYASRNTAYGINLSTATRVYFVSPVWQTAVERQAIKRAHRIGQTKPVYVETLFISGSMEEEILKRRSELGEGSTKEAATPVDDGNMKQILSAAKFVPAPQGMRDVITESNLDTAQPSPLSRASIPRLSQAIPFLKPKRSAAHRTGVSEGEGAGSSTSQLKGVVRFIGVSDEEQDVDDGTSRSLGIVDYDSSSGEEEDNGDAVVAATAMAIPVKRKRVEEASLEEPRPKKALPSLPDAFLELYPDKCGKSDDPSIHQGRLRSTPHVLGNWATHVYVEISVNSDLRDLLTKIITTAQGSHSYNDENSTIHPLFSDRAINDGDGFHSEGNLLPSSIKLHISLSRCIFLKEFQLNRFTELLRGALEGRKRYWLDLMRIVLNFTLRPHMPLFPSHYPVFHFRLRASSILPMMRARDPLLALRLGLATMSFIWLTLHCIAYSIDYQLLACLGAVDDAVSKFGQLKFYDPPRFHTSIAWSLTLPPIIEGLKRVADAGLQEELAEHRIHVDRITCKMGNRVVRLEIS